jgi:hypothetical protein
MHGILDVNSIGLTTTWVSRLLDQGRCLVDTASDEAPAPGDLALFRVTAIGYHAFVITGDNERLRLRVGDTFIGVFGHRSAAETFEGEVAGTGDLSLLTAGGMVGTLTARHANVSRATSVTFRGFLNDERGRRINTKRAFRPAEPVFCPRNLVLVIGTGTRTDNLPTASMLIRRLTDAHVGVAAVSVAGDVSHRAETEMRAAGAAAVVDFSDYGFPSTARCSGDELVGLFHTALADVEHARADVVVMDIEGGLLQREPDLLLRSRAVKRLTGGVVLTADSPAAALYGTDWLTRLGYVVIAVAGAMTSSPLLVREFQARSSLPVAAGGDAASALAHIVTQSLRAAE